MKIHDFQSIINNTNYNSLYQLLDNVFGTSPISKYEDSDVASTVYDEPDDASEKDDQNISSDNEFRRLLEERIRRKIPSHMNEDLHSDDDEEFFEDQSIQSIIESHPGDIESDDDLPYIDSDEEKY